MGKKLIEYSFQQAAALGYDIIVIFGDPKNYVSCGFKSCKKFNICLDGRTWIYYESPVMQIDEQEAQRFDEGFEKLEKRYQPSQEEFYIHFHATIP